MPVFLKALAFSIAESTQVQVDEEGLKVRPIHKRSIVILREIPEGTTQQVGRPSPN